MLGMANSRKGKIRRKVLECISKSFLETDIDARQNFAW